MSGFAERMAAVRARIARACAVCGRDPRQIAVLAVSKNQPIDAIREAIAAGQVAFGERRVQELTDKAGQLAAEPVRWQMIGNVQTNKVRQLCGVRALELVHSVDREKLVDRLQETCAELGRTVDVLVQVNATGETQKHGTQPDAVHTLARHVIAAAPALRLVGVMAMGPLAGDPAPVFATVARLHRELRDACGLPLPILSLGMSDDLEPAIAAGSTLLRIGSALY